MIEVGLEKLNLDKKNAEKKIENAKKSLQQKLGLKKVTIFLSLDGKEKGKVVVQKEGGSEEEGVSVKKSGSKEADASVKKTDLGFFQKIAGRFFSNNSAAKSKDDTKKDFDRDDNSKQGKKSPKQGGGLNQSKSPNQNQSTKQPSSKSPIPKVKKLIAVASAKGGVGKSTFAVNLAASLSKIGHKVALLDADIYGPSIPTLLNITKKPEVKDNLLEPIIKHNIKTMSIGLMIDDDAAGVWRGAMITKILHQLIRSVNWAFDDKEVDYMIIDMPPGTGDIYLSLAQSFPLDACVIVSTPQSVAVKDVIRSIDCFEKLNIPILGLVQNMAFIEDENGKKQYIFGQDNAKKMAKEHNIRFLGDIPLKQEVSDSNEEQIPYTIKEKSSQLSFAYGTIAEDIIDQLKLVEENKA